MATIIPWGRPFVCSACRASRRTTSFARPLSTSIKRKATLRDQLDELRIDPSRNPQASTRQRVGGRDLQTIPKQQSLPPKRPQQEQSKLSEPVQISRAGTSISTDAALTHDESLTVRRIQEDVLQILELNSVPEEAPILETLRKAQQLAEVLVQSQSSRNKQQTRLDEVENGEGTGSSFFSDLSEGSDSTELPAASLSDSQRSELALALAKSIYILLEDPKIYISDTILNLYVETLVSLRLPQYLPKIFHLYATKPIPKPNSNPITFTQPYASAPKYAVPPHLADLAIECAIQARDMPLAIALIDTTVATPAFKSAKFIRKAALPLTLTSSVIPLTWTLSNYASHWQVTWEPGTFFWMCIAGSTAYLGTMGTLLFITVTTWNDHHKRVRWVPGTPMTRRWFREEERYYFDRIAQAWGFQDENRHGEETGEEWEALRELLGYRWFELDRSSLLPGML